MTLTEIFDFETINTKRHKKNLSSLHAQTLLTKYFPIVQSKYLLYNNLNR